VTKASGSAVVGLVLSVAMGALGVHLPACVPSGSAAPYDAGVSSSKPAVTAAFVPSQNIMTKPFEDDFSRASAPAPSASAALEGDATPAPASDLGPDWTQAGTTVWHIHNGQLCGDGARNHGVWLNRVLPVNARIEFDATSDTTDGDLKAEFWGDGHSAATAISYTNATSYLAILGGWKNKFHVLARVNEHGKDRKEISVDPNSDDPRERPVVVGQTYHFKIERTDGKTVKWSVDGLEFLTYPDDQPLAGQGHDHFGFNDWDAKVCFDNVRVTPL
jgi:hypothetical protein